MTKFSDDDFRAEAKQVWESEGQIEIDDDAPVGRADESEEPVYGAYVQAWVWVEFDEDDDEDDDESIYCGNCGMSHTEPECGEGS